MSFHRHDVDRYHLIPNNFIVVALLTNNDINNGTGYRVFNAKPSGIFYFLK